MRTTIPTAGKLRAPWLLALAVPVCIVLASCSTSEDSSVASLEDPASASTGVAEVTGDDSGLAFTQCMRENGVDMPDPDPNGGFGGGAGNIDQNDPQVKDAISACQDLRPGGGIAERTFDAEAQAQFVELAKCMREQGLDFPDPHFDANGNVVGGNPSGMNPGDPTFREAIQTCREELQFSVGGRQ